MSRFSIRIRFNMLGQLKGPETLFILAKEKDKTLEQKKRMEQSYTRALDNSHAYISVHFGSRRKGNTSIILHDGGILS